MATGAPGVFAAGGSAAGATGDDPAAEHYAAVKAPDARTLNAVVLDYLVHGCYAETARSFGAACQLDVSGAGGHDGHSGGGHDAHGSGGMAMDVDSGGPASIVAPGSLAGAATTNNNGDASMTDAKTAVGGMSGCVADDGAATDSSADLSHLAGPMRTLEPRRRLRELILAGRLDEAVAFCNATFPGLLAAGSPQAIDVCFALKCQQFIECIRKSASDALIFAQNELGKFANMNAKYKETLEDVIALIAYTEPETSPLAIHMSQARREQVASSLNSYILSTHEASSKPAVERLVAHATVLRDYLHTDSSKDKKGAANKIVYPRWQLSGFVGN